MRYLPQTKKNIAEMLETIGAGSIGDLFSSIPDSCRPKESLNLPTPLSELELRRLLDDLGAKNTAPSSCRRTLSFLGAGLYPHYVPAAVSALASRGEFATAYTPYQPELSQGTLTAIFEFQTAVSELFGTDYANASMYDGASASAEAILMATRLTGRSRVILSGGLHPEYSDTGKTYASGLGSDILNIERLPPDSAGTCTSAALSAHLREDTAAVVFQTPNFFGCLEDIASLAPSIHSAGALVIVVCPEPLALALVEAPGKTGADIVVGEGAGLAGPITLGGPGVGLFGASGKQALRQMPGRIAGQTEDLDGNTGYVLTLSTREQHIRRAKATSNICTNHGLCALRFMIHLSLLGANGFCKLAEHVFAKNTYLRHSIDSIGGFRLRFADPTFNEFSLQVPGGSADRFGEYCAARDIVPGVLLGRFYPDLQDTILVSCHEGHRKVDLDRLLDAMRTFDPEAITPDSSIPTKEQNGG